MTSRLAFITLWAVALQAHAPLLPAIVGPVEARGNQLVDVGTGATVVLRGVTLTERSPVAFGVIRVRWNLNAVRLPVNLATWRQDVDRLVSDVQAANSAELLAIVAAGNSSGNGLPGDDALAFWTEFAGRIRSNPRVMFSLFDEPSTRNVPGATAGVRASADWRFWLSGGTARDGSGTVGMQTIVDAIRATGARQLIAVSAYHDALGFQGLGDDQMVRGTNIVYEAHPSFAFGTADTIFRTVAARAPVYAGDWGLGADCAGLSRDPQNVAGVINQTLTYFDMQSVSWTASPFRPGGLVTDFISFAPTTLGNEVSCANQGSGLGELLLLWTTGDPGGFGLLSANLVANSAGGLPGPIAPGELLTLYVEQLGPAVGVAARLTADGKLPVNIEGAEVRFDGVPVPVLYAGAFQLNVQVPYELRPGTPVTAQVFYRGVPSNQVKLEVAASAPELFQDAATRYALALNEDGAPNGPARPARAGSIVVLFASGGGQTSPAGSTGAAAASPHPRLTLPASVSVDGRPAEVLFAGEVPGFFGLVQVNVRVPTLTNGGVRPVPVTLTVGARTSGAATLIWVRD